MDKKKYIEQDAAIHAIEYRITKLMKDPEFRKKHADIDLYGAKQNIQAIPAADVEKVRHGENIGEDYDAVDQFVCDQCGIELQGWYRVERDMDDGEETHHEYVMRYCPNCGARMDGGVNA